ncbi:mpv17-like protein isoform X2 [Amblyraja radiata]|uniref:mpv17-like protein isoform X2 n=1 Tax=Amblyraja radiata TaxID=386614 RepID=UPI001402DB63|nr:mpv17-like protein isoform X2 [Amblyraja radiata]
MRGTCGVCVWTVTINKGTSEASSSMRDVAVGRSAPARGLVQQELASSLSLSTLLRAAGVGLQEEAASWRWRGPMWKLVVSKIRRFPWISNVAMYATVFTAGDVVQQNLFKKEPLDLKRTRNVTTLALTFHGNFVYLWLKAMENVFPGASMGTVLRKLVCDQLIATPTGISAYYIASGIQHQSSSVHRQQQPPALTALHSLHRPHTSQTSHFIAHLRFNVAN